MKIKSHNWYILIDTSNLQTRLFRFFFLVPATQAIWFAFLLPVTTSLKTVLHSMLKDGMYEMVTIKFSALHVTKKTASSSSAISTT